MKKFRILMGATALALVAAIVIACTKEKETKVAQQATETEEVVRKPIATYDNATGKMIYHISVDQIQNALTNNTTDGDRYVLESWCVVDDETVSSFPYLKYVVIDTEFEVSHSTVLLESFVVKEGFNYYLSEAVLNAHYNYTAESADGATFIFEVDGNEISITEWDGVSTAPPGGSSCTCTSNKLCSEGVEGPVCNPDNSSGLGWDCLPKCGNYVGAECNKSVTTSVVTASILSGLSI